MKKNEERNERTGFTGGQVCLGFLAGAAAGAVTAVLSAPRSGTDTRRRIRDLAEEGRERAQRIPEALAEATEAAKQAFTESLAEADRHPRRS
jgi:gas vesicle protein